MSRPTRTVVLMTALLAAGFCLRLVNISESRLIFHPTRQYWGLSLARWEYLQGRKDVPPNVLRAAEENGRDAGQLEPRVLEGLAAAGYRIVGEEKVWLGGAISAFLWTIGGACLFLLSRRLASDLAAGIALVIYLFLPFGVIASRTFQPDPAMVTGVLACMLGLVRDHDRSTRTSALLAGSVAGVAILIKPMAAFLVFGCFVALRFGRDAPGRGLLSRRSLLIVAPALGPAAAYYGFQYLAHGAVATSADTSFVPSLFTKAEYWSRWSDVIAHTVGWPLAVMAIVSSKVASRKIARRVIAGGLLGYVALGLVFNYHIHTHDYYSLPLVPLVALGAGLAVDAAATWARTFELRSLFRMVSAASVVALGGLLAVSAADAVRLRPPLSIARLPSQAEHIGDAVGHSTNTVMLSQYYGYLLRYEGHLAGNAWPSHASGDFRAMRLRGEAIPDAKELLRRIHPEPEWFLVTDLEELERQPDLKALLQEIGHLTSQGEGYQIYDLREAVEEEVSATGRHD